MDLHKLAGLDLTARFVIAWDAAGGCGAFSVVGSDPFPLGHDQEKPAEIAPDACSGGVILLGNWRYLL